MIKVSDCKSFAFAASLAEALSDIIPCRLYCRAIGRAPQMYVVLYVSSVGALRRCCGDLKESVSISSREVFTHSRGKISPASTAGLQRLEHRSNVMAHCPSPPLQPAGKQSRTPFPHNYCICSRRSIRRNRRRRFTVTE